MAKKTIIFNRGSVLPSILDLESELAELERQSQMESDKLVSDAHESALKIIEDTKEEIRKIERDERAKLFEIVDDRVESLIRDEERDIAELSRRIEKHKSGSIKALLDIIIPGRIQDRT